MKIILASNNKHKLEEIRKITAPLGYEVISQSEAGCNFDGYPYAGDGRSGMHPHCKRKISGYLYHHSDNL